MEIAYQIASDLQLRSMLGSFVYNETNSNKLEDNKPTQSYLLELEGCKIQVFTNSFWTARQRAGHSLQEISYRACFKPQLPNFFITKLTNPGDVVYDPFMGRGTTLVEAFLLGRSAYGCDVNPLSKALIEPRLSPPPCFDIEQRLSKVDLNYHNSYYPEELLVFYHPDTLKEILAWRQYFISKTKAGTMDIVDYWLRMVCINRLTGHSPGFFSVYTMPPDQGVTVKSQIKINQKRQQSPPYKDTKAIILKKSAKLLANPLPQNCKKSLKHLLLTEKSSSTPQIPDNTVQLVVTSPPFLDIVNYSKDNWLRCWFLDVDPDSVPIAIHRKLEDWQTFIENTIKELARVLKPNGWMAFEVGEVRKGKIKLEETVVPAGIKAGLTPAAIMINQQKFTKTANCWGVSNNSKGTNSNRIVIFHK